MFRWYLQTLGRWTFNQADVVFCYTDEDRKRVREFGVDSRIEVVANGIDTERFTPNGPASDVIDHDGPVVLFVGRLVEGKRPQDAVRAVSRLSDKCDVKLYVVADSTAKATESTINYQRLCRNARRSREGGVCAPIVITRAGRDHRAVHDA